MKKMIQSIMLATLLLLGAVAPNTILLTNSHAKEDETSDAISALVWSGIATACLSMSTVIFFFFFKMKDTVTDDTTTEKKDN